MDPKNWGWRRRSSEKTITTSESIVNVLNIPTGTEVQAIPVDNEPKPDLSASTLNQKLASVLVDCQKNDELELSETGKVETEVEQPRLELSDALSRLAAANENSSRLESQLEERNEQLTVIREDSKRKVQDAETSRDYLEDKLSESSQKLVAASAELLAKEMLIEDLSRCKSQAEAEFNALMCRLDSTEKENAFLKYEYCVLEKELAIRTDELEYHRQSADSSHRKHLDSLKKIGKLEGEIHQLRVLMQKRLPSSASMTKMKNEVKMLESSSTKKLPSNKVNYLVEKLCDVEEENKALKELVARKETELESSRALCSKTSLRLSELEATRQGMELVKVNDENRKVNDENRTSSSGSWANALISELENFRIEKLNPVEINNLAIVSVPENETRKTTEISFDWLQVVLNAMTEQTRISNRSLLELFEDVSIALGFMNQTESPSIKISGYLPWKSPSSKGEDDYHRSEFSKAVQKLARLVESFTPTKSDYFVRVFQWKSSELSVVQENVLRACSDLLDEKYDVETFVQELADALEWIMNSDSTTPKNASRDRIKRRINFTEKDDLDNHSPSKLDKNSSFGDENSDQTADIKLKSANDELQKAEQCIESLKSEVEELKEAKLALEDQMENQKAINVDLDTQLTMTKSKHNEILQKLSSLEIELDEKKRCCEDLESTCLELQLQLESAGKESPRNPIQMVAQSGWEITSASVKLAECQETIVNLGRQLKALASPKERSLFEKVLSTTNPPNALLKKSLSKRSSLRDRMLAEDDHPVQSNEEESPECTGDGQRHKNGGLSRAIVPSKKKQNGIGFLRRLLLRRTRGSIKKSSVDKTISLR